jgi:hypothetical protein
VSSQILTSPKISRLRISNKEPWCTSNLKQVGVAFRLFASDHEGNYPWHTFPLDGGTYGPQAGDAWQNYTIVSKELGSPQLLACPSDPATRLVTSWSAGTSGFANPGNRGRALSYFTGLDAFEQYPLTLMAGDRNIVGGESGMCKSVSPDPGVAAVLLKKDNTNIAWDKTVHRFRGVVAVGDGSVQMVDSRSLRVLVFQSSGELTSKGLVTIGGAAPNNHVLPPR